MKTAVSVPDNIFHRAEHLASSERRSRSDVYSSNVRLTARQTGLSRESVANVSQIVALDKGILSERTGKLSSAKLELVLVGVDIVLGR